MTVLVAHRGLHREHPENSLAAIEAGLAHVPVVEVDVRCTHDGVPACTHDPTLERIAGDPRRVGELDWPELRAAAPHVPRLEAVLDLVAGLGGAAMLDVKSTRPRAIEAIERAVEASRMTWGERAAIRRGEPLAPATLSFQSADPELLQRVGSRTGAPCLELVRGGTSVRDLLLAVPLLATYAHGATIPDEIATPAVLRALRAVRVGSWVYTVDDPVRVGELERGRAAGIYTDAVDQLAPTG